MLERTPPPLIGDSAVMQRVRDLIERFGPTGIPVLVVGPTGVGKDLIAQHIHAASGRTGRWVPVNCGSLPHEMADSLLFGHRRGSFSGAIESRVGHTQHAAGGTLFLDEILSLPEPTQVKLLRVLEDGEVYPLGENEPTRVDIRFVAAAQEENVGGARSGLLRRDLFRRLAGIVINVPPLSERPEDVLPLARHFAAGNGQVLERDAEHVLANYEWPDNVRELRQAMERARYLVTNGSLPGVAIAEALDLGASYQRTDGARTKWRAELPRLCAMHGYDSRRIAAALGISRSVLFDRLKWAGLSLRELRRTNEVVQSS